MSLTTNLITNVSATIIKEFSINDGNAIFVYHAGSVGDAVVTLEVKETQGGTWQILATIVSDVPFLDDKIPLGAPLRINVVTTTGTGIFVTMHTDSREVGKGRGW